MILLLKTYIGGFIVIGLVGTAGIVIPKNLKVNEILYDKDDFKVSVLTPMNSFGVTEVKFFVITEVNPECKILDDYTSHISKILKSKTGYIITFTNILTSQDMGIKPLKHITEK